MSLFCLANRTKLSFHIFNHKLPLNHSNSLFHTGNHTPHGQAASIWTEDLTLALETAKRCFCTSIHSVLNSFFCVFPFFVQFLLFFGWLCISARVFIVVTHLTLLLANFVWNMKLLWPLFPPSLVCQLVQCGLTPILCLTPACRFLVTKTVEPAQMEDRRWALTRVEVTPRHCTCVFPSC